jgi:heat shock protein HslJ
MISLCGCNLIPTPQITPITDEQPVIIPELNGTFWMVTSINGSDPINGTYLTLAFVDGWATGNAGCNEFGGEYSSNKEGEVEVLFLLRHEVSCVEPPGVMEQEDVFLNILEEIEQYQLVEGKLRLDAKDEYLLLGYLVLTE